MSHTLDLVTSNVVSFILGIFSSKVAGWHDSYKNAIEKAHLNAVKLRNVAYGISFSLKTDGGNVKYDFTGSHYRVIKLPFTVTELEWDHLAQEIQQIKDVFFLELKSCNNRLTKLLSGEHYACRRAVFTEYPGLGLDLYASKECGLLACAVQMSNLLKITKKSHEEYCAWGNDVTIRNMPYQSWKEGVGRSRNKLESCWVCYTRMTEYLEWIIPFIKDEY